MEMSKSDAKKSVSESFLFIHPVIMLTEAYTTFDPKHTQTDIPVDKRL